MTRRTKDPLAPLELVVSLVWGLMVLSLLVVVPLAIFGSGSLNGVGAGSPEVCVEASPGEGAYISWDSGEPATSGEGFKGLRSGVRENTSSVEVCDPEPDTTLRFIEAVGALISPIGGLAFFWRLRRVLQVARRDGFFADRVPRGLSGLGVLLLGWTAAEWLGGTLLDSLAFQRMLTDESLAVIWRDLPFGMVLGGVGLVTLGRVLAHAVALREDVEATI